MTRKMRGHQLITMKQAAFDIPPTLPQGKLIVSEAPAA